MIPKIKACSVCWGIGRTIDGKPCPCGCMPNIVTSKPEDYGMPSYQQLREQIATLTRQRDLAVEALTSISNQSMGEDGCYYSNRACIKTAKNALSTIKESEVK